MEEQSFAYEKIKDEIRILRCYGTSSRVVIPKELEGMRVTELSDYAFAKEQKQELENAGGLPCICGENLEELYLPDTIRRLGRYVFYNCIRFRRLSFYSSIAFMGAGGFTGCGALSHLIFHQKEGTSCLREVLQDLKQPVAVDCFLAGEEESKESSGFDKGQGREPDCRLVYPEFYEEAVENTPARIISTQTHGMGIQYRNTFQNTQIVFKEYDKLFETGKYNMDLTNIIEMAAARLRYPYSLEESAKQEYRDWLKEHLEAAAEYFLGKEDLETLRWMADTFAETREEIQILIQAANDRGEAELLSSFLHVLHQRFPGKKKSFDLL